MKIKQIEEITYHEVYTDNDKTYIRYGPNSWVERVYYDIMSDEYDVPQLAEELEGLYQIELGYEPMNEEDSAKLYNADPNCKHVHDPNNWSGIKCCKCNGWYCL